MEYTWLMLLITGIVHSIDEYSLIPDEIVKRYAKDFNELRKMGPKPDVLQLLMSNNTPKTTTTGKPKKMITKELYAKLEYWRCMRHLKDLISRENKMPAFSNITYDIEKIGQDIENLTSNVKANLTRRHSQYYYEVSDHTDYQKDQIQELMEYTIFRTQYFLIEVQQMIKKYHTNPLYKFGYIAAFVKDLKQQQRMLYSVMDLHKSEISTMHAFVVMYGKTLHLDRDLRDAMTHMKSKHRELKRLEYENRTNSEKVLASR